MPVDLSKWSPFKFACRGCEQRPATAGTTVSPGGGVATAAWPDADRLLQALDPFALLPGLLRGPLASEQGGRWFGDFSPAVFQPRMDVADDGAGIAKKRRTVAGPTGSDARA